LLCQDEISLVLRFIALIKPKPYGSIYWLIIGLFRGLILTNLLKISQIALHAFKGGFKAHFILGDYFSS
jgi:hypothetical protein